MPDYRRWRVEGATYFFTIVTHRRRPLFAEAGNVELLRSALRNAQARRPFQLDAAVILPDHIHFLWTLPSGDVDFSNRIAHMKVAFSRALKPHCEYRRSKSRHEKRESSVWQRRFWEHLIRSNDDFERCLHYIHYNPVKHGYARCPYNWSASSFTKWVKYGVYDEGWGCSCSPNMVDTLHVPEIGTFSGE